MVIFAVKYILTAAIAVSPAHRDTLLLEFRDVRADGWLFRVLAGPFRVEIPDGG